MFPTFQSCWISPVKSSSILARLTHSTLCYSTWELLAAHRDNCGEDGCVSALPLPSLCSISEFARSLLCSQVPIFMPPAWQMRLGSERFCFRAFATLTPASCSLGLFRVLLIFPSCRLGQGTAAVRALATSVAGTHPGL